MDIQNREEIIELYDLYGSLLTEKQQCYFEDYYYMDLSLAEIAENYSISRNGVFDQLKRVAGILEDYENNLHLREKIKKIESLNIDSIVKEEILGIIKE